jgi:tetratricopeptide (TPR) repeat protein
MSLLVVGTYRDTDLHRGHPLSSVLADLRRERSVERLDLPGLDGGEVAELMAASAGHELDESGLSLADAIHDETGGNPFFVGEVLVHLAESGAIYERDGRWVSDHQDVAELGVPEGVREVIGRRLSALDDQADTALRTASAVGQEFDLVVLAHMLDTDADRLLDTLEAPLRRGLVQEVAGAVDRFRFAHALVRQALYEELSASRRVRLHHRVSAALEATGHGTLAERAHHACEAAVVAGAERAVELAVGAAAEASAQLAWEEAARWYRRALEAEEAVDEPDPVRRGHLLVGLALARNEAGEVSEARADALAAADLARRAGDAELLAGAAVAYGGQFGTWVDGTDAAGPALVDEALRVLDDDDTPLRIKVLLRRAGWQTFVLDPAERLADTEAALAAARRLGDPALLCEALALRAESLRGLPRVAELAEVAAEMDSIADLAGVRLTVLGSRYWLGTAAMASGRLDEAARVARMWADDLERNRSAVLRFGVESLTGSLAYLRGRFEDAERHIDTCESLMGAMGAVGPVIVSAMRSTVLLLSGRTDEFEQHEEANEAADSQLVSIQPWRAVLAAELGDHERAAALLETWVRDVMPLLPAWISAASVGYASHAARRLSPDVAHTLYERLLPYEGVWLAAGLEVVIGSSDLALARYAAAAGRPDEAIERFGRAIAGHDAAGEVTFRTRAAVELAELLAARGGPGDDDRARALASAALRTARDRGMRTAAGRAEAVLTPG